MKNILCFGDSNTWGYTPGTRVRYPADVRWTGVLAQALGEDYHVMEDGLNGRTTVFDDPCHPGLKGSDQLPVSLQVHKPLDLVVLCLGSNDLKFVSARWSARGTETLLRQILFDPNCPMDAVPTFPNGPKVLLVSPILVWEGLPETNPYGTLANGYEESTQFAPELKRMADAYHVEFLNAADYGEPSHIDGVHMSPESHKKLGLAIAQKVREMLG